MVKRTKSIRAVEALEAVKERIDIELDTIRVGLSPEDVREEILKIIKEQLEKEE